MSKPYIRYEIGFQNRISQEWTVVKKIHVSKDEPTIDDLIKHVDKCREIYSNERYGIVKITEEVIEI